jgi:hypothetical protein
VPTKARRYCIREGLVRGVQLLRKLGELARELVLYVARYRATTQRAVRRPQTRAGRCQPRTIGRTAGAQWPSGAEVGTSYGLATDLRYQMCRGRPPG